MKHREWSIGRRLALGFGTSLLLLGFLAAFTLVQMQRIGVLERELVTVIGPRADGADALQTAYLHQAIAIRSYAFTHAERHLHDSEKARQEGRRALDRLQHLPSSQDGAVLLAEIALLMNRYNQAAVQFLALVRRGAGEPSLRAAELGLVAIRGRLGERTAAYQTLQHQQRAAARFAMVEAQRTMKQALLVLVVLVLAVGGVTAWVTTRSVRDPVLRLVQVVRALGRGDYEPAQVLGRATAASAPGPGSSASRERSANELTELTGSVLRMAESLHQREERLSADAQLCTGLAASIEVEELAAPALRQMAAYAGCEFGAVYLLDPEAACLRRIARHALEGAAATLQIGEGIPGQVAADRRRLILRDIPPDAPFRLRFGFEDLPPRTVAAFPMLVQEHLVGILLLGSLRELSGAALDFIEHACPLLGVSLQNAQAHRRLGLLATELQLRNEELAAQNEELQAQSEEIQAQQEELESQNEEVRAQSEELVAQNEELTESDRRKNEFLAMLAHELRNPLAAMSNAFDLLHRGQPQTPAWERALAVIERQIRHQTSLINDLLDVSRITRGRIELQRVPVDLVKLVSETAQDCDRPFVDAQVERVLEFPDEPVWVSGDPTRLSQVVANLLHNAAKFTNPGGQVRVMVATEAEWAVIRVQDTGIGIDPRLLPGVFDVFTQADRSLDRSRGGLGLGLALVKGLVELHGGAVQAESDGTGHGAAFTVRLPVNPPAAPLPSGDAEAETRAAVVHVQVLVVEDNEDAALTLRDLLELDRHRVEVVFSGPAALEAARSLQPDVVLCDIGLPGMDGYAVAQRLRRSPATRSLRLVALTGYGSAEDRQRALEAGFDDHLVKPVETQKLRQVLAGATTRRAAREGTVAGGEAGENREEPGPGGGVLIVEDEPPIREALADLLRRAGYPVATAGNGQEALAYLRTNPPPGLILLDLEMPVMNGWTFRSEQLQDPPLVPIPVVVLTGAGEEPQQPAFMDAAGSLAKPVEGTRLLETAARYCSL